MRKILSLLLIGGALFGVYIVDGTDSPKATYPPSAMHIKLSGPDTVFIAGFIDNNIYCYRSVDGGITWNPGYPVPPDEWWKYGFGEGTYTSLEYNPDIGAYTPIIEIWKNETSDSLWVYYGAYNTYKDLYIGPYPIFGIERPQGEPGHPVPVVSFLPPTVVQNSDGIVNTAFKYASRGTQQVNGYTYGWDLWVGNFPFSYPDSVVWEKIDSCYSLYQGERNDNLVAMTIDPNGAPHILYDMQEGDGPGEIYYQSKQTGVWSGRVNLSTSTRFAMEPTITMDGPTTIKAVWVENDTLYQQRKYYYEDPDVWIKYPDLVPGQDLSAHNRYPQAVGPYVAWSESLNGDWDVVMSGSGINGKINVSNDSLHYDKYANIAYQLGTDSAYVYVTWTKGISAPGSVLPYSIVDTIITVPLPVYYSVSVGDSIPSPYTVYRDGYIVYPSGISVDYAENTLEYNLPYLNAEYAYTLVVIGYHESQGKWNELVKIDGKKGKVLKVSAGTPDTLTIEIPLKYYEGDNAVDLTIKRLTGDYAAVSGIYLYQKARKTPGIGGPQLSGAKISSQFYARLISNPSRSTATIEYSLKNRTNVNLRIYDIAGRLVAEPINKEMDAGIHRISWKGNTSGIYFYRLKAGKETATGKIILVK